eukprot:11897253-Ditylum_brightwellii.AAC.1
MDNNPVRIELLGDIEKEADSTDTEQENRNTQISYKGQHTRQVYCSSTTSKEHTVFIHDIERVKEPVTYLALTCCYTAYTCERCCDKFTTTKCLIPECK